jgi:large subunit ribosomal protein L5
MSDLKKTYQQKIVPRLLKELNLKNPWAVPKIEKVVINVGLGEAVTDKGVIEKVAEVLKAITGQKPKTTKARLSVSGFKLRKGSPIGLAVTLRQDRMFHFLEKLFKIVLPRLRDFQGLSPKSFDGKGNYTLGLPEQTIFPEVDYDKIDKIRGLEITIVTSAESDEKAKLLLEKLGMPFERNERGQ